MTEYRDYQETDWQAICQIHDRARLRTHKIG